MFIIKYLNSNDSNTPMRHLYFKDDNISLAKSNTDGTNWSKLFDIEPPIQYITDKTKAGLTVNSLYPFTVTLDYIRKYGRVFAAELHLTTSVNENKDTAHGIFTTNAKYAVINGVYFGGTVPISGNAWVKLKSDIVTNGNYNFTMVGII